jgi:hypothetical protein
VKVLKEDDVVITTTKEVSPLEDKLGIDKVQGTTGKKPKKSKGREKSEEKAKVKVKSKVPDRQCAIM